MIDDEERGAVGGMSGRESEVLLESHFTNQKSHMT
jgi:hypothetical protein